MDEYYMNTALDLAKMGLGWTNPNPLVGAVIVKNNKIISKGYHARHGELHAERMAILNCNEDMEGATLYVNLEPCCHYGITPPCTEAIIESGIKRVVIGMLDPNPLVSGKGVKKLKENNIEVEVGVLEEECKKINEVFIHFIKSKEPFVLMKYAMTLDGKICTHSGESKWITCDKSRENVQKTRHRYSGIMVGVDTVIKDDPMLTCRIDNGNSPVRIICDTDLRTPIDSKLVTSANDYKTIIATCCTDEHKIRTYTDLGCEFIRQNKNERSINLKSLMKDLGKLGIDSILLEGGSTLNWSALNEGIVNRVQAYVSPKIFGGKDAKSPVAGEGVAFPNDAIKLSKPKISVIGEDILLESEVIRCSQE